MFDVTFDSSGCIRHEHCGSSLGLCRPLALVGRAFMVAPAQAHEVKEQKQKNTAVRICPPFSVATQMSCDVVCTLTVLLVILGIDYCPCSIILKTFVQERIRCHVPCAFGSSSVFFPPLGLEFAHRGFTVRGWGVQKRNSRECRGSAVYQKINTNKRNSCVQREREFFAT